MSANTHSAITAGPLIRRPMVDVSTASSMLDCDEDEVLALVDSGAVVALNIAVGTKQRELRIVTLSMSQLGDRDAKARAMHRCALSADDVIGILAPGAGNKAGFASRQIRRLVSCSRKHVLRLIEAGELQLVPGTQVARGNCGETKVSRDSFIRFCRARLCS